MRNKKIFLGIILLLIVILPVCAQYDSENDFDTRLSKDEKSVMIVAYYGGKQNVNIPPRIEGLPVSRIDDGAFLNCHKIINITIPDSVTSIGNNSFNGCVSLTGIIIPNSVISIGEGVFLDCRKLADVTISNKVTKIGRKAFENCYELKKIIIPNSVTEIGNGAFFRCTNLAEITIPDSITVIGRSVFEKCTNFTAINVDVNNKVYSSQNGVLYNKNKTELILFPLGKGGAFTIPDSVTSIGANAFYDCKNLTSVTIGKNVIGIGESAFHDCEKLTGVIIPNNVTKIEQWAFIYCKGLTSVTIGKNVTGIGQGAFSSCTGLTGITIPSSVTSLAGNIVSGCTNLTAINVDVNNKTYSSQDGVLYNKNKTELIWYPAGKKDASFTIPNSVTAIGNWSFDNKYLSSIIIPDSVVTIERKAFNDCPGLASVKFEGNIKLDEEAFLGDLYKKFYATDAKNGTPGTYTTTAPVDNNSKWTRKP